MVGVVLTIEPNERERTAVDGGGGRGGPLGFTVGGGTAGGVEEEVEEGPPRVRVLGIVVRPDLRERG